MIKVQHSVTIHRPAREVYNYISNPDNWHNWQSNLVQLQKTGEGEFVEVRKVLGRRVERAHRIHEVEKGKKLFVQGQVKHESGTFGQDTHYTVESVDESTTLVTVALDVDPEGIFKGSSPVVGRVLHRDLQAGLGHLKDLLESEQDLREDMGKVPAHQ
jgi:uncharacterized protein YndB with AHSA1/START domain